MAMAMGMLRPLILWAMTDRSGGGRQALRVALYARVSTEAQAEEGKSIPAQLNEMREYAGSRGWQIVAEFIDPGLTGSDMERPGLQALLATVEQRQCDVVLVHELSRLSRRLYDTFELFETFGRHEVGFASVKDNDFDFSSPNGRLFLTLVAALNQYYVDLLKMHTAKSKRQRAHDGLYNASTAPYGYQHVGDQNTPPVIVPEEAALVRQLFERYATGKYSYQELADWLTDNGYRTHAGNNFSKDTLADMLRNPFYKGYVWYRQGKRGQDIGELFPGKHEAIVSDEVWELCRQIREQRRAAPRTYQLKYRTYLLNGIVTCDICGRSLRAQGTRAGAYYREASRLRGFTDCPAAGRGARMDLVDAQIDVLFRHLELPADWQHELRQTLEGEEENQVLENRQGRLVAERRRLKRMRIRGDFDEDEDLYERELARVQRELAEMPAATDYGTLEDAATLLTNFSAMWDEATLTERRDLLRTALREVQVDVEQNLVTLLKPYPVFLPLFRRVPLLQELSFGVFAPVWEPELVAAELSQLNVEPAIRVMPDPATAPDWPVVLHVPLELMGERITPILSRWLKARSRGGEERGRIVELCHPRVPPLRSDVRKWPEARVQRVSTLEEVGDEAAWFLWTPFAFQTGEELLLFIEAARRVVGRGGVWAFWNTFPAAMTTHWLYRFFPEVSESVQYWNWDAMRLFNTLSISGFSPTLTRRTYYQPLTLGAALALARQREASPQLRGLADEVYLTRLAALEAEAQARGAETLIGSQFTLVEVLATRV